MILCAGGGVGVCVRGRGGHQQEMKNWSHGASFQKTFQQQTPRRGCSVLLNYQYLCQRVEEEDPREPPPVYQSAAAVY